MTLYDHQNAAIIEVSDKERVAFYHDMGLGKTYTGAEQLIKYGKHMNLVICQKSKVRDWVEHFLNNYWDTNVCDLTAVPVKDFKDFLLKSERTPVEHTILVINYELAFRRPELLNLTDFTLMLDESSLIQNEQAKRTKFILKLHPAHVILLSGTPTGGKYEKLYSQLKLLGMPLSKNTFYNTYIEYHFEDFGTGARVLTVDGYKNVDRLKRKMKSYGCHFLKTDEVMDLPEQTFIPVRVDSSKEYKKYKKSSVVNVSGIDLVGDNPLVKLLHERQLCGEFSTDKLDAFEDLVNSTEDRLIVFYNFNTELEELLKRSADRPASIINGTVKDLSAYEEYSNSITFIQYQAGAMGLNLQKANKIIYYTPPLSSELYEQSKKRIHRIGQTGTCYYYKLICKGSVEEKIYKVLAMRQDYTAKLFESEE